MKKTIAAILGGGYDNCILPFMWLHGEDESVIREYMRAIHSANIGAVCVESRPHPDFAGPKWWSDMDVILDEAKKMGMKVWILDDSHFPTGYANGKMADAPDELCRQCLVYRSVPCPPSGGELVLDMDECRRITPFVPNSEMERYDVEHRNKRVWNDDRLIGLVAVRKGGRLPDGIIDLSGRISGDTLRFTVPEGEWTLYILHLTRNRGARRQYINMMSAKSCRILIDAVHELFWQRYKDEFGSTIAGFFSDEPELGNGHLYETGKPIWRLEDQAWSSEVEEELRGRYGDSWVSLMPLLWDTDFDPEAAADVRLGYMDSVTRLVERNFSEQIGGWCRERGVKYIGHLIEDQNQHFRTGPSLGHYFRGLGGQDMSGIDCIGWQVSPQGEHDTEKRTGRFYHFVLGRLAASQAAVDPMKHGDSMCEIFGGYGWKEGIRTEKYLADHFLVRNINHFVPHAFSLRDYPDSDCPPHFYLRGSDPQFRHFGRLMLYMNRVSTLLRSGSPVSDTAILYAAESDWMGRCMPPEDIAEPLARNQISYDFIPADVFSRPERYDTDLSGGLSVNGRRYKALIIPACDHLAPCVKAAVPLLESKGVRVIDAGITAPGMIPAALKEIGAEAPALSPDNPDLRTLHICGDIDAWMLVNEGSEAWTGELTMPTVGGCVRYDAWDNRLHTVKTDRGDDSTTVYLTVRPLHSVILLFGYDPDAGSVIPEARLSEKLLLTDGWRRSVCRAVDYPWFENEKTVSLPDVLADEMPHFSGFVRYENSFVMGSDQKRANVIVTDAYEGVELFINGVSLGLQIAPPFRYDITSAVKPGKNTIMIEVATTLERENASDDTPSCPSGINGICEIEWSGGSDTGEMR